MSSPLTNLYISNTYTGLLHSGGIPLPNTGKAQMYDGSGTESALSLGVLGQGASISGSLSTTQLKVGTLNYASTPGALSAVAFMIDANTVGFSSDLPGSILADIITPKVYSNINTVTITAQGLISNITEYDTTTITQTIYVNNPTSNSNTDTVTLAANQAWAAVDFGGGLNGYKGAIIYMEPIGTNAGEQKWYKVDSSPDQVRIFPVGMDFGGESGDHSNEPFIGGRQFTCPCSTNGVIYFRHNITSGPTDDFSSVLATWKLNLIAKLK